MAPLKWLGLVFAVLAIAPPPGALAQENTTESAVFEAIAIPTRFTVDYHSSGGGYDGLAGLGLIQPLYQEPGQRFDYFLGRLNLSNSAELGGNLLFGSRQRESCGTEPGACLVGGYAGFDFTHTPAGLLPQLGVGVEVLSDLEFRLNGYLPLGDSRRRLETGQFVSPTGYQFQGQNLVFVDDNHPNRYQVALSGIDLEVGGKLLKLGRDGDLRAYGGTYNYGGQGTRRYWGGQFRLEARPTKALSFGGGVQFDPEFGTNLLFRIGAAFPTLAEQQQQGGENQSAEVLLAGAPRRRSAVVVAQRSEPFVGDIAVEPMTGKPVEFIHVLPGSAAGGIGSIEAPVSTVVDATELAQTTTDIIYVQSGPAGPGFTIPSGVAVLSVAPEQRIATQFGAVLLPNSGQGEAAQPVVTNTITMGQETRLSGFLVQPPAERFGIVSASLPGLSAIGGAHVEVLANDVQAARTQGAVPFAYPGLSEASIGSREPIASQPIAIQGNTIVTQGDDAAGILMQIGGFNGNPDSVRILDNTVVTQGDRSPGIDIGINSTVPVDISSNMVTTHGEDSQGIRAESYWFGGPITLSDNVVTTHGNGSPGIVATAVANRTNTGGFATGGLLNIEQNRVTTDGDRSGGIFGSGGTVKMIENRVVTRGENSSGIQGEGVSSRGSDQFMVISNLVATDGQGSDGIQIRSDAIGNNGIIATISGNNLEPSGQNGVRFEWQKILFPGGNDPKFCVTLVDNRSQQSGLGVDYQFLDRDGTGRFQLVDSSPLFLDTRGRNIGTFSFEPITSFSNVPACPEPR